MLDDRQPKSAFDFFKANANVSGEEIEFVTGDQEVKKIPDGNQNDDGGKTEEEKKAEAERLDAERITAEAEAKAEQDKLNAEKQNNEFIDNKGIDNEEVQRTNLSLLTQELIESDLLPNYDVSNLDKLKPEEQLEAFKAMHAEQTEAKASAIVEDWIEKMPDDLKYLIDNYKEGVPFDQLLQVASQKQSYSSIKEEELDDESKATKVMSYFYSEKGFSPDEIEEQIAILKHGEKLTDTAKSTLPKVNSMVQQKEIQIKEAEKQRKEFEIKRANEYNEQFKSLIKITDEIIPGIKITDVEKKQIFETTIPDRTGKSRLQKMWEEDGLGMQQKMNYYTSIGLFDKKPNVSKIISVLEGKAKGAAFDTIRGNESKNKLTSIASGSGSMKEKPKSLDTLFRDNIGSSLTW